METFNNKFFNELAKFENPTFSSLTASDGFRLTVADAYSAGEVSNNFLKVTRGFVNLLKIQSDGRYVFEDDFCLDYQRSACNYSKGKVGRKQLYVGFNAPLLNPYLANHWGVSIGLCFDFRNKQGVFIECINEYEAFFAKVDDDPELFDSTFGGPNGYTEPAMGLEKIANAEKVICTLPTILHDRQFFGKFIHAEALTAMQSLDDFVDESVRVFDEICEAGYMDCDVKNTDTSGT